VVWPLLVDHGFGIGCLAHSERSALAVLLLASTIVFIAPLAGPVIVFDIVGCVILLGFCILAILSVGWFYAPSLIAAAIAAFGTPRLGAHAPRSE
jgi:hypothetical protein